MDAKELDLVVYGATGFVGRQVSVYLSRHAPAGLRWAMAGRRRPRLEDLAAALPGPTRPSRVLVADSRHPATVDAAVGPAAVVLATAGPFALHGTPVVDACVRHRTHYVDITGETSWVRELVRAYHDRAAADGTRIVPCCGFDSVPSDVGTLSVVRELQRLGTPCDEVRAYFRLRGGLNGGTVASGLQELEAGGAQAAADPFALGPASPSPRQRERSEDLTSARHDPAVGAWTAPFVMARINTRVVRRSAALLAAWGEGYGDDFVYGEAMRLDPPLAAVKAHATARAMGAFEALLRWRPARRAASRLLPGPGQGPSEGTMDGGWFSCELLGLERGRPRARARMRYAGDPGNRATTTFVSEAALTLCAAAGALPGGAGRGGVLTPASALGLPYADRLRAAGLELTLST